MQRTAIYARVSTGRQVKEGESVQAQLKALHEYVSSHDDLILVGEFVDEGISGQKSEERDELQRLLTMVKNNEIDLILFCKLDRFFRSMRYYVNTQELLDKHHVQWKSLFENYDTTTPQGRLIVSQMMSIAQFEAENTTQRINAVFEYKIQRGEVLSGKQPIGYSIVDKRLVLNEDAPAVAKAFEVYANTGKLFKAIEAFETMTGREYKIAKNFKELLRNEKYTGCFRGNANYCPPIVSKELFDTVQRILDARPTHQRYHDHIFSGLLYCAECGKRMGVNKYKREVKHGSYYVVSYFCNEHKRRHGTCPNRTTYTEAKIEEFLLGNIQGQISYIYGEKSSDDDAIRRKEIEKKIEVTKAKLKRLKDLYILGDFEINDYISKKEALEEELSISEAELNKIESAVPNEYVELALLGNVKMIYSGLHTNEEKKVFWANLIKKIWIGTDRSIKIELP